MSNDDNKEINTATDALHVANWFIKRAKQEGKVLIINKILQLIYIAHGYSLGAGNGPLFHNKVEAWEYGPVVIDVYNAYKKQFKNTDGYVRKTFKVNCENKRHNLDLYLDWIWQVHGGKNAHDLTVETKCEGSPWDIMIGIGMFYSVIPNSLIELFYKKVIFQSIALHENLALKNCTCGNTNKDAD